MGRRPPKEDAKPLPHSDELAAAEVEPDTLIASRQIENVRALWRAEARLLYRDARLKDLMAQRRELRGDIQDAEQSIRRKRTKLAEVEREIPELRPPGDLKKG